MECLTSDEENDTDKCKLCADQFLNINHLISEQHRYNLAVEEFSRYRKALSKNREGVEISVSTKNEILSKPLLIRGPNRKCQHITELSEAEMATQTNGVKYTFTVKSKNDIYLTFCDKIYKDNMYKIFKLNNADILNDKFIQLTKNVPFNIELTCNAKYSGEYIMQMAFRFQTLDNTKTFAILKTMVVIINSGTETTENIPREKSKFTQLKWGVYQLVRRLNPPKHSNQHTVPKQELDVLIRGVKEWKGMSNVDKNHVDKISSILKNDIVTQDKFIEYFQYLLWLDEVGAEIQMCRYNMETVKLELLENNVIRLKVEGLAEKRPSLLRNDLVHIRLHLAKIAYEGEIKSVESEHINVYRFQIDLINLIRENPNAIFDVKFIMNRFSYERMHRSILLCAKERKFNLLFPMQKLQKPKHHFLTIRFVNENIKRNIEQAQAVMNILNASSGNAPYIVFGPPGTGKTVTIVEAIVQIIIHMPKSKILVSAPTNAACDMLAIKLLKYFNKEQLYRVYSNNYDDTLIPEEMKTYSNYRNPEKVSGMDLKKYSVVVATLIAAGNFSYTHSYIASHVFIDEAAQAKEPEAIVGIAGILKTDGQLVLAGDPLQLGPICNSRVAEKNGLGISLLSRLMALPLYNHTNRHSICYITKLLNNYRNHRAILHLPNELFYRGELKAVSLNNDRINQVVLRITKDRLLGFPIEFFAVSGTESKKGKTPSFYNTHEINIVMKYVNALLTEDHGCNVIPEDIGIITPYIRQVQQIRARLNEFPGVEVGSTETFQGREKRIIIISTVRGQANLLLYDRKYNLGFVANDKRFNVAITRAQSKLIVIGNPLCLYTNKNWEKLIEFCKENNSYRGYKISKRDCHVRRNILGNMDKCKFKSKF